MEQKRTRCLIERFCSRPNSEDELESPRVGGYPLDHAFPRRSIGPSTFGKHMSMLARARRYIHFGTERYPAKTARRLRALNLTTMIAAIVATAFAFAQFLDPTPGVWKVATVNAV